uniref:cysteine dioxygenase n=1 Tax=Aegilops tauschii subsp. strangulata TaxID=200361 RepID=A0A453KLN4_AEGTS
AVRPAKVVRDGEISAPCAAMVLRPTDGGNVHALKAITPCAILDILSPPYSSKDGRHCSYFRRRQKSDPSGQCRYLPWTKNNHALLTVVWLQYLNFLHVCYCFSRHFMGPNKGV